jgi:pyocin large subunit-like protein
VAKNLANLTAIAIKIANGHAFSEHINEFAHLGITKNSDFTNHAKTVLLTPTESFVGKNGKEYFWHESSKTFAVIDKANPDMGTMFIPIRGKQYFLDQKIN